MTPVASQGFNCERFLGVYNSHLADNRDQTESFRYEDLPARYRMQPPSRGENSLHAQATSLIISPHSAVQRSVMPRDPVAQTLSFFKARFYQAI
jgi:hypothetical protein